MKILSITNSRLSKTSKHEFFSTLFNVYAAHSLEEKVLISSVIDLYFSYVIEERFHRIIARSDESITQEIMSFNPPYLMKMKFSDRLKQMLKTDQLGNSADDRALLSILNITLKEKKIETFNVLNSFYYENDRIIIRSIENNIIDLIDSDPKYALMLRLMLPYDRSYYRDDAPERSVNKIEQVITLMNNGLSVKKLLSTTKRTSSDNDIFCSLVDKKYYQYASDYVSSSKLRAPKSYLCLLSLAVAENDQNILNVYFSKMDDFLMLSILTNYLAANND
jgi:hypothetical protein